MPQKIPHDHFCNECGALYPCPKLEECPFSDDPDDFEGRIGLCTRCAPHTHVCSHCGDEWDCVRTPCTVPAITICERCSEGRMESTDEKA